MARRAVFIDALGTMLWLEPPWERIDPAAIAGLPPERVREGFLAEMAFYAERTGEGSDAERLADLRRRCAEVLSRELGREIGVQTMMDAIRFRAFPEVAGALSELRAQGLRVVCVSNWDCSLPAVLDQLGLGPLLDGVVTSATAGARKPDPEIFAPALELAGCGAEDALHVGDSDDDLEAARAAGIAALRIDRAAGVGSRGPDEPGVISSLNEISDHLAR